MGSRPTRGAWIEMLEPSQSKEVEQIVAPHTGRVD